MLTFKKIDIVIVIVNNIEIKPPNKNYVGLTTEGHQGHTHQSANWEVAPPSLISLATGDGPASDLKKKGGASGLLCSLDWTFY